MHPRTSDDEFCRIWRLYFSPTQVAAHAGMSIRNVHQRANALRAGGYDLPVFHHNTRHPVETSWTYPPEIRWSMSNAVVMVASDLHIWPESHHPRPAIQRVFLQLAHELQPTAIVLAGDLIDASRICRHGGIRGQAMPTVADEAGAMAQYLRELPAAEHRAVTMGNHDLRVDNFLAAQASELADWAGRLSDRTPDWQWAYSVVINDNTEIRHDWHGGLHAAYNNVLRSGVSFVTGHTHDLDIRPYQDRRGMRYGVQCGMLNDPRGPQWEWTHGRPSRARSGFAVLTYDDQGRLLPPELCEWLDGRAVFRGRVL